MFWFFFVIFIGFYVFLVLFEYIYMVDLSEVVVENDFWKVWYIVILYFDGVWEEIDCCFGL